MIELTLLGLQAIRTDDGRELGTLPAQPKRFALLAYLALGGGAGYHRRDSLAAMFWPDLDQFAARRALRNTLYHLREALGEGVILTRGEDAVSIDPARLTCDVARLDAAVAAGRYEEAIDRFKGELLAGVHFLNAGEGFEEWLSGERLRVGELVMRAVRSLVDREEQGGDLAAAARWSQRACMLAPGDERWLRKTMALLDRSGDTGGALRLYHASVRRLAADYDATPSPETEALAERVRDGRRKPVPAHDAGSHIDPHTDRLAERSTADTPPADRPPLPLGISTPVSRTLAGRRRKVLLWTAAAGAAAVISVLVARAAGAHTSDTRSRVLVTAFDNRTGDPALQPLGRMAQDWLSQGLFRTQLVDVVDARAMMEQRRTNPAAAFDPVALARRTGARLAVSGAYYRSGDSLLLQATLTDARTGRISRVVGPVVSSTRAPVAGLDELRSRVMTALATVVDLHAGALVTSDEIPPFEAYEWYLDGWDAFSHGDGRRAEALFLKAARRDTGFVSALLSAASTASNYSHCALVDSLSSSLSARPLVRVDRLSIEISSAKCHGSNEEMLRLSLERAELLPRTSGVLGSVAAAAMWANRPAEALELLRRIDPRTDLAFSTDTSHVAYWGGYTAALHALGRHAEELAVADHMTGGAPLSRAFFRATALAALHRPTAALGVLDSAGSLPVETADNVGLAPYTDGRPQYDATPGWIDWWVACEFAVHGDTIASRQAAMRSLAWYRGRSAEERATFEERLVAAWALDVAGRYADADSVARGLLAGDSSNVDVRGELAAMAARLGETARADSLDRWLAAQPVSRAGWSALVYRARLAAVRGRGDDAVARLREALDVGAWATWIHIDPAFIPLHGRRDFMALIAPRG